MSCDNLSARQRQRLRDQHHVGLSQNGNQSMLILFGIYIMQYKTKLESYFNKLLEHLYINIRSI